MDESSDCECYAAWSEPGITTDVEAQASGSYSRREA
jgi:hypothetical protein